MLMVTHSCNLNCTYCYEKHKSKRMMSAEMAKEIIMKEFDLVRQSQQFTELEIDFMGGEPLVNFRLIKEIVEWLEGMEKAPAPYICFATTNATLLDDEKKAWFREHRDTIWLGASYDGSSDMQSMNRGSGHIDLEFFKELWPEQGLQMTISKQSLPGMAQGIIDMTQKGYHIEASVAQGVAWNAKDAAEYYKQLNLLANWYCEHPEYPPLNRLSGYMGISSETERQQYCKSCGSGTAMCTYDTDGRKYGCHMFTPVVMGDEKALELSALDWDNPALMSSQTCDTCVLKMVCSTCPGFNYHYRGALGARDMNRCVMALAEAKAACAFQLRWYALRENALQKDDLQRVKMALNAYEILEKIPLTGSDQGPYQVSHSV